MSEFELLDFSPLFKYAETEYGISWNKANDVFFNNILDYGKINRVYPSDMMQRGYAVYDLEKETSTRIFAEQFDRDAVLELPELDQACLIMSLWLKSIGKMDSEMVLIDCD